MLLVIYLHVINLTFENFQTSNSIINLFFTSFRMPMFFFLSGFIAYKSIEYWNYKNFLLQLSKKTRIQLIPTFVFFILLSIFNFNDYHSSFPGGYWFTLVLFEMFFIYYVISLICYKTIKILRFPLLIILSLGLSIFNKFFTNNILLDYLAFHNVCFYFLYFVVGLIVRKFFSIIMTILLKEYTLFFLFIFTISIFVWEEYENYFSFKLIGINIIKALSLILIFFSFFYLNKNLWSVQSSLNKIMIYIGRRTLDLYLIHYFFLKPSVPQIGELINSSGNIVLELLFGFIWTSVIVLLCLLVSNLLRTSKILSKYLFGVSKSMKLQYNH